MKAIWVLENIKSSDFSMSEIDLMCLIASVANWKTLHPESKRHLYCDLSVYQYLDNLEILFLWDYIDTDLLETEDLINRKAFWAASKIKCIESIQTPFVLVDCDLYLKTDKLNLRNLSKFKIVVNQIEECNGVYPNRRDPILKDLINENADLIQYKTSHAANVSFLYLGNEKFKKHYAEMAYSWMERLSIENPDNPGLNGKYMIFCEQKLLKELADFYQYEVAALSDRFVVRENRSFEKLSELYPCFNLEEDLDYVHLHTKKREVLTNENLFMDIKSDIINSIVKLDSFPTKLLHSCILKNRTIGPLL